MDYFFKASAIIILFYTCYKLFLQNETYFQSNRWFLLIGLFVATVLPLVIIPIYIEYTPTPITITENLNFTPQHIQPNTDNIDLTTIIMVIYLAGMLFFLGKVMLQFWSLHSLFKSYKKTKYNQFIFIETDKDIAPFSFFNHIVLNTNQFTEEELKHVITHEKIHAKQYHSIDIILIQIATILLWFNPYIWWYKKALQQNLEFIADYEAQNKIECAKSYQTVLLKASLSQNQLALPTNFYQSLIKKRIIMLQKSKSKKSSYFKLAIILPFLGLFLMSFNVKEVYIPITEATVNNTNTEIFTITSTSSDQEIETIKNRLEAKTDGLKIRFTDIKRNSNNEIINLSIETKSKDKSEFIKHVTYKDEKSIGNIVLTIEKGKLVFVYEEFETNVEVTKKELTTIISEPKSKKQEKKIEYSYETFTIDENGNKSESKSYTPSKEQPLYVLNGKIVNENKEAFIDIDADEIVSVNVLKGENAIDKYGEKGKNGVVEIITKRKNNKISLKENDSVRKENPWKINSGVTEVTIFEVDKTNSEDINLLSKKLNDPNSKILIIKNEQEITKEDLFKIPNNTIKSVTILKEEKAVTKYGEKAKDGVIEIITKDQSPWEITYEVNNKKQKDSIPKESPWKISNVEVTSLIYVDDKDPSKNASTFNISKKTPEAILNLHKASLKVQGVDLQFSTIKRNKKDEIIKIKISVEDKNGNKSKVAYESNKGINPIEIKLSGSGDVTISSK